MFKSLKTSLTAVLLALGTASAGGATLQSQYGILDLTANGGINPNTGLAWAAGDQYRLAFHTIGKSTAASSDPAVYNAFVTAQANLSTLGNGSITTSTGWTAMISTTTTNARVNTGTNDLTGGHTVGGAGVPVYAMDGTTAIARNNADIWNAWSNPFETNLTTADPTGNGNNTVRVTGVFYSPFLNQNGLQSQDVDVNHGVTVWTGSNSNGTALVGQEAGNITPNANLQINTNHGNTNANNTTRIWNRGQSDNDVATHSFYAISPLLTVTVIPEPSSLALLGLGGLLIARRRRG